MKFLVDAHLPLSLCGLLEKRGHSAIHTSQLPAANRTKDGVITQISMAEHRVVVTKDTDFFHSHMLYGRPWKLLLVKTGNISTSDLIGLFDHNLQSIEQAFQEFSLVEIDRSEVSSIV